MFELRPYRRNSINVWNPFSEMEEMEKRLFNNSFFLFFSFWCFKEFKNRIESFLINI